jgi:hypothetical protein
MNKHGGFSGKSNNNSIDHSEVSPVGLKQQKCTEESPAPSYFTDNTKRHTVGIHRCKDYNSYTNDGGVS